MLPEFKVNKSYRILLAEDNPVNRLAACRFLEKAGHQAVCVNDGHMALQELAAGEFDCVLMDIQMPTLDGLEAIEKIRNGEVHGVDRDIPVIALTAHAMRGDREAILRAGFNDYLAKPVDMDALLLTIANQMRCQR